MRMTGAEGVAPSGTVSRSQGREGVAGIVNELLIQMQSFDDPPTFQRFLNRIKDLINLFLPLNHQVLKKSVDYANVLVIAATNRADMLDPALMRPGRFDRKLYFDLPSRAGRRDLIDYFLAKKRHAPDLDDATKRDDLAGMTFGYTPAMMEHIFDESLVWALRGGRDAMTWEDVTHAKLTTEIGLPNRVVYTDDERRQIATHEAGHATVAYLAGAGRKLEVLSIVKRRDALGLLGHSDLEERFTKTRSELEGLVKISLAGMVAEEIFTGESGTGPAGDLAYATTVAAEMIGSLGLGDSLVSYRAIGDAGVLDPGLVGRVLRNADTKKAVDLLLHREKKETQTLIENHKHLVTALRDALLEHDELIGEEIIAVLEAAGGKKPRRTVARGRSARAASRGRPSTAPSKPR
jgi:ATP-dependent Zn protease